MKTTENRSKERDDKVLDWERAFAAYGKREAKFNLESAAKVLSNSFIEHHANNRFRLYHSLPRARNERKPS